MNVIPVLALSSGTLPIAENLLPWRSETTAKEVFAAIEERDDDEILILSGLVKKGGNACEAQDVKAEWEWNEIEDHSVYVVPVKHSNVLTRQSCALYYAPVYEKVRVEIPLRNLTKEILVENYVSWGTTKTIHIGTLRNKEGDQ